MVNAAIAVILAGLAALAGYSAYLIVTLLIPDREAPLVVRVAIPAIGAGLIVLLASAVWYRLRTRGAEADWMKEARP